MYKRQLTRAEVMILADALIMGREKELRAVAKANREAVVIDRVVIKSL